jgi:hypothetical protein
MLEFDDRDAAFLGGRDLACAETAVGDDQEGGVQPAQHGPPYDAPGFEGAEGRTHALGEIDRGPGREPRQGIGDRGGGDGDAAAPRHQRRQRGSERRCGKGERARLDRTDPAAVRPGLDQRHLPSERGQPLGQLVEDRIAHDLVGAPAGKRCDHPGDGGRVRYRSRGGEAEKAQHAHPGGKPRLMARQTRRWRGCP